MNNVKNNIKNLGGGCGSIIRRVALSIALVAAFAGAAPLAAFAQQQAMSDNPTAAELEQFRADLAQITKELNAGVAALHRNPLLHDAFAKLKTPEHQRNFQEMNARAENQLESMTLDELAVVYRAFKTKFPQWREAPQALDRIAEKVNSNFTAQGRISASRSPGGANNTAAIETGGTTANAITPDNCQDAFNAAPSWTDWAFTKGYEIAAMAAYEVVPEPLNGIAMAAWIPLAEGVLAAETLNNIYDRCSGDKDNAEMLAAINNVKSTLTNINQQIQENDDDNASYIVNTLQTALNTAKTAIINNDNSNKTDVINNDNTNRTTITTAITNAKNEINSANTANTTTITNAVTDAKNTIVTNDNSNRTLIVNNDNANRETIINNDNSNRTQIINNANQNTQTLNTAITHAKTEIINNANANRDLAVRIEIEQNLAAPLESTANVALFSMPAAKGGYLELVRQIVGGHIANVTVITWRQQAETLFNQANQTIATGDYVAAYTLYRKSYRAAAGGTQVPK